MSFTIDYSQSGYSEQEIEQAAAAASGVVIPKLLFGDLPQLPTGDLVLLVGIGGSSLGAAALARALGLQSKLCIADVIDPDALTSITDTLHDLYAQDKRAVLVVVSKSGTTLETLTNADVLLAAFRTLDQEYKQRTIVVTDENSPLWETAAHQGFLRVASPRDVSGRFSVFTPVGLVPLTCVGVDSTILLAGAQKMLEACSHQKPAGNLALYGAAVAWLHTSHGRPIHVLWSTNPRLDTMGRWWRQLVAESMSKDGKGITPVASDLADLHVMTQRYFDGPKDVYTRFFDVKAPASVQIPQDTFTENGSHSGDEITKAISHGIRQAYQTKKLPFGTVVIDDVTPNTLGALCMLLMLETIYSAALFGVNAFNQPGVETYKKEVSKILGT